MKMHGAKHDGRWSIGPQDVVPLTDHLVEQGVDIIPDDDVGIALRIHAANIRIDLENVEDSCKALPFQLYPYQIEGIGYLATHNRACLFDEMGLGKTVQAIMAIPFYASIVIVCPASLRLTWQQEGIKWRPGIYWDVIKESSKLIKPEPKQAIICSPEAVVRNGSILNGASVLVCDEAHMYKNPKAKRSQAVQRLAGTCARVWAMTGTPMTNAPPDLAGVLQTFGLFERAFATRHTFDTMFGCKWNHHMERVEWPTEPPHSDAIVRALGRVSIRRKRADVLPEIPQKTYAEIVCDLAGSNVTIPETTSEQREMYRAVDKSGLGVVDFEAYTNFAEVRAALAAAKTAQVLEIIEQFQSQGTPLVVCSCNLAPLQAMTKADHLTITGDVSHKLRARAVELFQDGDVDIIGIQTLAGGVGITLTRAHHMLMVQRDWSPALNEQAEDRICRIGQKNAVVIYDLLANHPLDEIISRALRDKQKRISATVDRVEHTIRSGRALVERMIQLAEFIDGRN